MAIHLNLYGTAACHLCETASALLRDIKPRMALSWTEIDIAEDSELLSRYGIKIPVLYREDNAAELCWPFSTADILTFIR
ncbi:MAG TPA: glutaredoxin family protein [Methylophilaceae bacterium]|nr:glutaredoxin family protein [Methylophilaceae bacterium]